MDFELELPNLTLKLDIYITEKFKMKFFTKMKEKKG